MSITPDQGITSSKKAFQLAKTARLADSMQVCWPCLNRARGGEMLPISLQARWHGARASAKVATSVSAGDHAMSGTGLRTLSLTLLIALVAYVAWSGGS
jgi:hypothetical protein